MLSEVEEKIKLTEFDEETKTNIIKVTIIYVKTKNYQVLYVRGDLVILISPSKLYK